MTTKTPQSISDDEYLESSGLDFLVRNLIYNCSTSKEDLLTFAVHFIGKVRSCHHILSSDISCVFATAHNRRSLVFCLMEAFQGFPLDSEISVSEFQQMVDLIFPGIFSKLPMDYILGERSSNTLQHTKFRFGHLKISLFFHIIYEEWLGHIANFYYDHATLNLLDILRLRSLLEELRLTLPYSVSQPIKESIEVALNALSIGNGTSEKKEISFEDFRKKLVATPQITEDVCASPLHALPIYDRTTSIDL